MFPIKNNKKIQMRLVLQNGPRHRRRHLFGERLAARGASSGVKGSNNGCGDLGRSSSQETAGGGDERVGTPTVSWV